VTIGYAGAGVIHSPPTAGPRRPSFSSHVPIVARVDLSTSDPEPSEEELGRGPLRVRREPCVCGEDLFIVDSEGFIQAAVEAHNRRPMHRDWRRSEGIAIDQSEGS
jgi:hypothetical protein